MTCFFDRIFNKLLKREGVETNLAFRFIDESRFGLKLMLPGWR